MVQHRDKEKGQSADYKCKDSRWTFRICDFNVLNYTDLLLVTVIMDQVARGRAFPPLKCSSSTLSRRGSGTLIKKLSGTANPTPYFQRVLILPSAATCRDRRYTAGSRTSRFRPTIDDLACSFRARSASASMITAGDKKQELVPCTYISNQAEDTWLRAY